MTRDQRRMYWISAFLCGLCLFALLLPFDGKLSGAVVLVPGAFLAFFGIPKRKSYSINKYQVLLIVGVSALLRILAHYLLGLVFGMGQRVLGVGVEWLLLTLLPVVCVIVASEIIRKVLLAQENRILTVLSYVVCLASEVLLAANLRSIERFPEVMDFLGLVLLPAIIGHLLYHYLTRRYGMLPATLWRLLMSLYPLLIPYDTLTPDAITALGGLLIPVLVYGFVELLYGRRRVTHKKPSRWIYVSVALSVFLMVSVVMIISCRFTYGAVVIGTGSMSGELNVGDAAVYEQYEDQTIREGDVVVFRSGNSRVIHRVVDIDDVAGETRYITKGDANEDADLGYRTDADIIGLVRFKIAAIGYPSLWLRDWISAFL